MGLLTTVLTFPVSVPVRGTWWVVDQVIAAAEAELFDENRILAELRELVAQVETGQIDEAEYEAAEAALLDRLAEARSRHSQPTEEAP